MDTVRTENAGRVSLREPKAISTALMVGASLFGGGSVAFEAFQLVRQEPDRAFRLLDSWGPGFLLAMLVAWLGSTILNRSLDVLGRIGDRMAAAQEGVTVQIQRIAEASHAQALALQTTADKDDREKQEIQILIGVLNSKVEQSLDEQKRQNRALERIENALKINQTQESERV